MAILGQSYGFVNANEISPTEKEFDEATAQHKYRICFIKTLPDHVEREERETAFVKKVEQVVVRKLFEDYEELQSAIYASLVRYLEEKELLRFLPFDAAHHPHVTLADIDSEKIKTFIQKAREKRNSKLKVTMSPKQLLTHLDLLDSQGRVTNAAILLFGKKPQRFFISSEVKCIQFYGNKMVKPVPVYQVYRGDLFELIEQALSFVLSRIDIRVGTRDYGSEAPTEYELPVPAVSEAIVNAIAHRDYTGNGSVQVMLFRNRLEICNPGTLPQGLSIEKLYLPHTSIPGNPLIANPLFLTGNIERVGTGISDMIEKCVSIGLKKPTFDQDESFKLTIWRNTETNNDIDGVKSENTKKNVPENVPENRLDSIISIIENNAEISMIELSKILNVNHKTVKRDIQALKTKGLIERIGPDKGGHWKVIK